MVAAPMTIVTKIGAGLKQSSTEHMAYTISAKPPSTAEEISPVIRAGIWPHLPPRMIMNDTNHKTVKIAEVPEKK